MPHKIHLDFPDPMTLDEEQRLLDMRRWLTVDHLLILIRIKQDTPYLADMADGWYPHLDSLKVAEIPAYRLKEEKLLEIARTRELERLGYLTLTADEAWTLTDWGLMALKFWTAYLYDTIRRPF
ncbi:MAG: hypothetical protein Q7U38_14270 [Methylobacter sp.]|nr:hypothetical protein [Methylobacter sp.]MDP2169663.1 hypothetical protein [Rhodocyclaceae bacterium]MDP2429024.1 hypothetical protein [Methylobacter sp.]MDP3056525.1 hypothetical protein [Methylobacter sp.]MDP3362014.1 hypothetical protein [Methylobacter sp.]